uniref:Uncharacterized protein n=1 Tax=Ananas comosus var. bracteatus TaxID=296719 RepID=A0A6V7QGX8_ANACO|nr:unnamed protein product [Ananas comosus var. bracteatus]
MLYATYNSMFHRDLNSKITETHTVLQSTIDHARPLPGAPHEQTSIADGSCICCGIAIFFLSVFLFCVFLTSSPPLGLGSHRCCCCPFYLHGLLVQAGPDDSAGRPTTAGEPLLQPSYRKMLSIRPQLPRVFKRSSTKRHCVLVAEQAKLRDVRGVHRGAAGRGDGEAGAGVQARVSYRVHRRVVVFAHNMPFMSGRDQATTVGGEGGGERGDVGPAFAPV